MKPFSPADGDSVVEPYTANGIAGEVLKVRTNLGTQVHAWRATNHSSDPLSSYFCHGYSLGTFRFQGAPPNAGYSVMSGKAMVQVLADEYWKIGNLRGPGANGMIGVRPHDLIVWWRGHDAVHSALIIVPVVTLGVISETATLVNSKTGTGTLRIRVPLATVHQDYPDTSLVEVHRRA